MSGYVSARTFGGIRFCSNVGMSMASKSMMSIAGDAVWTASLVFSRLMM